MISLVRRKKKDIIITNIKIKMQRKNIVITSIDGIREYRPEDLKLIAQTSQNGIRTEKYLFSQFQHLLRCLMQTPEVADNIIYLYRQGEKHKHFVYNNKSELTYFVETNVRSPFLQHR